MSHIDLIIEERAAEIGHFLVGRLLPFRQKRMVGPFIYIDHMGPVKLGADENFDILPHPHIGLSTLTYLLEGSIMHRDSLGTAFEIKAGAVNWMTAGSGITHSERTPDYLRGKPKSMHGLQIWVALPKEKELMAPDFTHVEAHSLPVWEDAGVQFKLIAGALGDKKADVPVHSPLYMLEIKANNEQTLDLGDLLFGEAGLYVLSGEVSIDGKRYGAKQMLVTTQSRLCAFTVYPGTQLYVFGGEPLPEERFIDWNFVATDKALIEAAKAKWMAGAFKPVVGDENAYIPYPVRKQA